MSHLKNICQIESCPICIRLQKNKEPPHLVCKLPKKNLGKPEKLRTVISTPIIVNSIGSAFVKLPETWETATHLHYLDVPGRKVGSMVIGSMGYFTPIYPIYK